MPQNRFLVFAVAGGICVAVLFCPSAASQGNNGSIPSEKGLARSSVGVRGVASAKPLLLKVAQNQAQPQNSAPALPVPYRTEILRFDNWLVTCNEFDSPKKRVCEARLQFVQANNTNQVLLEWLVWLNDNKQLQTRLQVPTGVNIPVGVDLQPEKGLSRKFAFESCETGFCRAGMIMDGNLVRDLSASATADVTVQASSGNRVRFNLPIKGFDKAYAALRS